MLVDKAPNPKFNTARIIWLALTFSLIPYVVVATIVSTPKEEPMPLVFALAIGGMGLFNLALSVGVRKFLSRSEALLASGKSAGELAQERFPLELGPLIMTWALAESAAIFGMVLTFLSGEVVYAYALSTLTIGVMLIFHKPRQLTASDFLDV